MGVWLVTIGVLLFDPKYYDSPIAPRELYDRALRVLQVFSGLGFGFTVRSFRRVYGGLGSGV